MLAAQALSDNGFVCEFKIISCCSEHYKFLALMFFLCLRLLSDVSLTNNSWVSFVICINDFQNKSLHSLWFSKVIGFCFMGSNIILLVSILMQDEINPLCKFTCSASEIFCNCNDSNCGQSVNFLAFFWWFRCLTDIVNLFIIYFLFSDYVLFLSYLQQLVCLCVPVLLMANCHYVQCLYCLNPYHDYTFYQQQNRQITKNQNLEINFIVVTFL